MKDWGWSFAGMVMLLALLIGLLVIITHQAGIAR